MGFVIRQKAAVAAGKKGAPRKRDGLDMGLFLRIPFFARSYDLYVILGSPHSPQIWYWENWRKVAAGLEPFVAVARDKAAVRTTQFINGGKNPSKDAVSFGRIGWSEKGHQRWTHGSPVTLDSSPSWAFLQMEMWSPTWSVCEREDRAPDVFFAFRNEAFWPRIDPLKFNQTIIFALSRNLNGALLVDARRWVLQLSAELQSPLVAYQKRAWGKARGSVGLFSDSIQDLVTVGLFKVGDYHNRAVDLDTFEEKWESLRPSP